MTINKITTAFNAKSYKNYIHYIRFPKYKNISPNTQINFDFPITVLVGPNGSGKSSILKALYGAVEGNSLGDFWFETGIDKITDIEGNRNCFIYNYTKAGRPINGEVLVQRAKRDGNPDYWEPAKPVKRYGMKNTDRISKLSTKCVYIDFHSILSAFDTYRYFLKRDSIVESNKYLRKKTNILKKSIDNNIEYKYKGNLHCRTPNILNEETLAIISNILGKSYKSGKIINHKLFLFWGKSVIFETDELTYSEAFAGSGETAVALLINELINLPEYSLILLDEPEVCLHPGAQKKMFEYLLNICLKKKHQIVISTHSSEYLQMLPNNAIKLFIEDNNFTSILNSCNYLSAFTLLGKNILAKKMIIVEDILAKEILINVAKEMEGKIEEQLNIIFFPGGHTEIKKAIAIMDYFKGRDIFVILDGDQNPGSFKKLNDLTHDIVSDHTKLNEHIKSIVGLSIINFIPQPSVNDKNILIPQLKNYINFIESNLFFLPDKTPEEIIWNDDNMMLYVDDEEIKNKILESNDYKDKFKILTQYMVGNSTSETILNIQRIFLKRWIMQKNEKFHTIESTIRLIIK